METLTGPRPAVGPPHPVVTVGGQELRACGTFQESAHLPNPVVLVVGHQQITPGTGRQSAHRPRARHHRTPHSAGFQDLVLQSSALTRGHDDHSGLRKVGAYIGHVRRQCDSRTVGQRLHRRNRSSSDNQQTGSATAVVQARPDTLGKPANGVDVGRELQRAHESQSARCGRRAARSEVLQVYPVGHHLESRVSDPAAREGGVDRRNKDRGGGLPRDPALISAV